MLDGFNIRNSLEKVSSKFSSALNLCYSHLCTCSLSLLLLLYWSKILPSVSPDPNPLFHTLKFLLFQCSLPDQLTSTLSSFSFQTPPIIYILPQHLATDCGASLFRFYFISVSLFSWLDCELSQHKENSLLWLHLSQLLAQYGIPMWCV